MLKILESLQIRDVDGNMKNISNVVKKLVTEYELNDRIIVLKARQVGVSTANSIFAFLTALTKPNTTIGIISSNINMASIIISKIRYIFGDSAEQYQFTKSKITFNNGSKIIASSSNQDSIKGVSLDVLIVDEAAYVKNMEEVICGLYPTLKPNSTVILSSTPNINDSYFSKLWKDSFSFNNPFIPIMIRWNDVDGRGKEFKTEMIKMIGLDNWKMEYDLKF